MPRHPLSGTRYPDAEAAAYLRALLRFVVAPLQATTLRALKRPLAAYQTLVAARTDSLVAENATAQGVTNRHDLLAHDEIGAVRRALGQAELSLGRTLNSPELLRAIEATATATDAASLALTATLLERARREKERKVGGVVPALDVFKNAPELKAARADFVRENVGLIKSLSSDTFAEIGQHVTKAMEDGLRGPQLQALLRERFGVSASRAALIATDQVGKFTGSLNKTRQVLAGVQVAGWSTSRDRRVRPSHAAVEGQEFQWSGGLVVDGVSTYPGQPIRCRCVAIPKLDKTPDAAAATVTAEGKAARAKAEYEAFMAPRRARAEAERAAHVERTAEAAAAARKAAHGAKTSEGMRAAAERRRAAAEAEVKAKIEASAAEAASRAIAEESARIAAAEAARLEAEAEIKRLAEAEALRLKTEVAALRKAEIAAKISATLKARAEAIRVAKVEDARKAAEAAKLALEAEAKAAALAAAKAAEDAKVAAKKAAALLKAKEKRAAVKAAAVAATAPVAPTIKLLKPADVVSITGSGGAGKVTLASGEVKTVVLGPLGGVRSAGLTESEFLAIRTRQLIDYGRPPTTARAMAEKEWADWGIAPLPAVSVATKALKSAVVPTLGYDPKAGAAEMAKLKPVQLKAIEFVRKSKEGERYRIRRAELVAQVEAKFGPEGVKYLQEQVAKAPLTINVPMEVRVGGQPIMELIADAGRSKNLFETGHGQGSTNKRARNSWERNIFGDHTYAANGSGAKNAELRPIYGALNVANVDGGPAKQYGAHATVTLRPEVRARVTFTRRNSSGSSPGEALTHEDVVGELIRATHSPEDLVEDARTPQDLWKVMQSRYQSTYFEMQVHGGVDWRNDIAEMHLHERLPRYSPRAHAAAVKFAATHKIPIKNGTW